MRVRYRSVSGAEIQAPRAAAGSDLSGRSDPRIEAPHASAWKVAVAGLAILLLALAVRLYGLGQYLTADDQDWLRRTIGFARAVERGRFRETFQSGHPGVPVLWMAYQALGSRRIAALSSADVSDTRFEKSSAYLGAIVDVRVVLACQTAALAVAIAWLCLRLFGARAALIAGLLLACEPFLVAHGQLFETDALLAALMMLSVLSALVYLEGRGGTAFLVGSGVLTGLAFSTKAPAILLFGFIPLVMVGYVAFGHGRWRADRHQLTWAAWRPTLRLRPSAIGLLVRDLAIWGASAALVYVALWPAMWVDPVGTLVRLERSVRGVGASPRRWGNFFLGTIYDDEDVALLLRPLFYPIVTALRLSPITFVGVLLLAGVAVGRLRVIRVGPGQLSGPALAIGLYVVLFTAMMTLSPKKLDRYLMPAYPALVILGALGLRSALRWLAWPRLDWLMIAGVGLAQAVLIAQVQPYSLSFYNPLLGGAAMARRATVVGWGEGLDQVAAYLNRQPDASNIVAVSLYKDQLVPLLAGTGARLPDWQKGTHLVDYVNMDQRDLVPVPLKVLLAEGEPDFTVAINGLVYARVYRIPPEIPAQFGDDRGPEPNAVPRP
jgi:4-amino-4-deoxy-L-arabinose transferase-like glycosyltransferase